MRPADLLATAFVNWRSCSPAEPAKPRGLGILRVDRRGRIFASSRGSLADPRQSGYCRGFASPAGTAKGVVMAAFRQHLAFSCALGAGYAVALRYVNFEPV